MIGAHLSPCQVHAGFLHGWMVVSVLVCDEILPTNPPIHGITMKNSSVCKIKGPLALLVCTYNTGLKTLGQDGV